MCYILWFCSFIGLLLPAGDLKAMSFIIGKSKFMWGDLISIIIGFTIIAFIVFLSYKQIQIKPILMTIS
jgi:large-conductance mechanosensitive channel